MEENQAVRRIKEKERKDALARQQDVVVLSYQGNEFILKINNPFSRDFYRLVDIKVHTNRLVLPGEYASLPIREFSLLRDLPSEMAQKVDVFVLSRQLYNLHLRNDTFPRLQTVIVPDKSCYSTDGTMIYRDGGRKLVYAMRAADRTSVTVPGSVTRIGRDAFRDAHFQEIIFENPEVSVEAGAFEGSRWERENAVLCIGHMLYQVTRQVDTVVVPEGVTHFHEDCFEKVVPRCLEISFFPRRKDLFPWKDPAGVGITKLRLTGRDAEIPIRDLCDWESLSLVEVCDNHRLYETREGVLFTKGGEELIFYPRQRPQEVYRVPEGVRVIWEEAFHGAAYLKTLSMGASVQTLGFRAFAQCPSLRQVTLSDGIGEIRSYPLGNQARAGMFSGCKALAEVALPKAVRRIERNAFYDTAIQRITLPKSLQSIGRGALGAVTKVAAWEGTAKGLPAALHPLPEGTVSEIWLHGHTADPLPALFLPARLSNRGLLALDKAWEGDHIDYDAYGEAFQETARGEDRWRMGLILAFQEEKEWGNEGKGEEKTGRVQKAVSPSPWREELLSHGYELGAILIEGRHLGAFASFLKLGLLSREGVEKLLQLCNEKEAPAFAACLLQEHRRCASGEWEGNSRFAL